MMLVTHFKLYLTDTGISPKIEKMCLKWDYKIGCISNVKDIWLEN